MAETARVVHDPDRSRYVLMRDGRELGETQYRLRDGVLTFVHTEIDPAVQEKGLGTMLVAGALDQVRSDREERVTATCRFVKHYLETHDETVDLTTR